MPSVTAADVRPVALIVDADADTRAMYALYLRDEGIEAVEAVNARQALEKAQSLRPDVITTDLLLFDQADVNLCERLRELDGTKSIPIIAVTAWAMPEDVKSALRSGCVSVLVKPCLPDVLLAEIKRVLEAFPRDRAHH
jgi:two-component system cell cycle response regulator DivK